MLRQRIVGMACGYESIADHDQLRNDPVLGVLGGSLTSKRSNCAALARKSTLNGLECRPDLVVRFGYGPSLPRSLRRPVDSVIAANVAH